MGEGPVRIVGGYDPLRDEFILSVHNIQDLREYENDYDPFDDIVDDGPSDPSDDECNELCAEFVVETNASAVIDTLGFQPGDQFSINYTITNIGEGIGSFANSSFSSYPFDQEGQPADFMFGNWADFVVQDPTAFVFYPQPTYDPDNGQIGIMDQDPNINLTTVDVGYTTVIEPPLNEQLASYYPQSIAAAPGGVALLFPGNSMSITVTYQVPMDYSPGDYSFFVSFNFASYDIDSFNQGFNLNPDYGAGGGTRYFAIPCCYTRSRTIVHQFTVDKPDTRDPVSFKESKLPTLPSTDIPIIDSDSNGDDVDDYTPDWYTGSNPVFAVSFDPCKHLSYPNSYPDGIFNVPARGRLKSAAEAEVNATDMDPLLILDAEGTVMSSKEFGGGGQFWNPYMGVTGPEFGCDNNPFDGWLIVFSATPLGDNT